MYNYSKKKLLYLFILHLHFIMMKTVNKDCHYSTKCGVLTYQTEFPSLQGN